jgi:hypothetical protein
MIKKHREQIIAMLTVAVDKCIEEEKTGQPAVSFEADIKFKCDGFTIISRPALDFERTSCTESSGRSD